MDIVDLGPRDLVTAGIQAPRFPVRRLIGRDWLPAILIAAGFVLVLASQWYSWFSVRLNTSDLPFDDPIDVHVATSVGMANSGSVTEIPYYLIWLAVFVCCASMLTARPRRRLWLGGALGALATQALIVMPIIHRPQALASGGVFNTFEPDLILRRTTGVYCVIAAMIVIAAGLGIALLARGESFDAALLAAAEPQTRETMHDALRSAVPISEPAADIEMAFPSQAGPIEPPVSVEVVDHSMYVRPVADPSSQ